MKTFQLQILIFLISFSFFGQNSPQKMIVILPNTTYSYYADTSCVNLPVNCSRQFNDVGLQAIFNTYSITVPEIGSYICNQGQNYSAAELIGISSSTNPAFTQDLQNYSQGVVAVDYISGTPNQVFYSLINNSIGSYQNITNGIVTTNNTELNQIFTDYNVFSITEFSQQKQISCNCNGVQLANSLNNLTSVTQSAFTSCGVVYLKNESFSKSKTIIFPNPFLTILTIETDEKITSFTVSDIIGNEILEAKSQNDLNTNLTSLNSGVYFLKLTFENKVSEIKKIIKK